MVLQLLAAIADGEAVGHLPGDELGQVLHEGLRKDLGGAACLLGALVFYRRLPELKRLVRPVYVRMGILPEVAKGIRTASEPGSGV